MHPQLIRARCLFCRGRGCLHCDTLVQAAYQRQFPDPPEPLVSLRRDDPEDMSLLAMLLAGTAASTSQTAFMAIFLQNVAQVRELQARLAESDREHVGE